MNFTLSEEQEMIRSMVRDFSKNELEPTAAERDAQQLFDRTIFHKMGELGLTGIPWPEKYHGIESDFLSYVLVIEEIARVCASSAVTLSTHISFASWPIFHFGTEGQKEKFLKPLAKGSKLGAYMDSDTEIKAVSQGESFVLSGTAKHVQNGEEADVYLVFAMVETEHGEQKSAFIVEKNTPGVSFGKKENKLGIRSSSSMEIVFEQCVIPKSNLLGVIGEGARIMSMTKKTSCLSSAAQAIGLAQGALDASAAYAKERQQFGKPIGQQQAIAFKLANMVSKIESSRYLNYLAAWKHMQGKEYTKDAAIANLFANQMVVDVTVEAVQVLGGYGYMQEYHVERYMRDAKVIQNLSYMDETKKQEIADIILSES